MIPFLHCTREGRGRRSLLFLGIADDAFDSLEDWMFGTGETLGAEHLTQADIMKRAPDA